MTDPLVNLREREIQVTEDQVVDLYHQLKERFDLAPDHPVLTDPEKIEEVAEALEAVYDWAMMSPLSRSGLAKTPKRGVQAILIFDLAIHIIPEATPWLNEMKVQVGIKVFKLSPADFVDFSIQAGSP